MNKKIFKYAFKGLIIFGTVNLLNGVSLKIIEQNKNTQKPAKIIKNNQPGVSVSNSEPTSQINNILCNRISPMKDLFITPNCHQFIQEDEDCAPTKTLYNISFITKDPIETASEKNRKNYRFPRIYGQLPIEKSSKSENIVPSEIPCPRPEVSHHDEYCDEGWNKARDPNDSIGTEREPFSARSSDNDRAAEEAFNQLIQGIMAQEQAGNALSRSNNSEIDVQRRDINKKNSPINAQKYTPENKSTKESLTVANNPTTINNIGSETSTEALQGDGERFERLQKNLKKLKKKNINTNNIIENQPKNSSENIQQCKATVKNANKLDKIPTHLEECIKKYDLMFEDICTNPTEQKVQAILEQSAQLQKESIEWLKKNEHNEQAKEIINDFKTLIKQKSDYLEHTIAEINENRDYPENQKCAACELLAILKSGFDTILNELNTPVNELPNKTNSSSQNTENTAENITFDHSQLKQPSELGDTKETVKKEGFMRNIFSKIGDAGLGITNFFNHHPIISNILKIGAMGLLP